MRLAGFSVPLIVLAFLLGLGSMVGLQYLYQNQRVDRPLAEYFQNDPRVEEADFQTGNDGLLSISLKLSVVPDFQNTYDELQEETKAILGHDRFRIEVLDERDDFLDQAYYDLHFALQEGVATGRFVEMSQNVRETADRAGLEQARVFVGSDALYIQLRHGDAYLYEIIPRRVNEVGYRAGEQR